jgi:hypothetical protein
MGATALISLVLTLLQSILAAAHVGGVPSDVIAAIDGATQNLIKVQGLPVTYSNLESLRVQTKW